MDPRVREEWKFCGLNHKYYFDMGIYKMLLEEWEKDVDGVS